MLKFDDIAVVVLAAGTSSRFGKDNKLLSPYKGKPMVRRLLDSIETIPFGQKILVTGHEADRVCRIAPTSFLSCHNKDYSLGMGSSISCGLSYLEEDISLVFIVPGDMPELGEGVFLL